MRRKRRTSTPRPFVDMTVGQSRCAGDGHRICLLHLPALRAPSTRAPFKQLKADYIDTGKISFIYREVYFDRYGLWASMVARCGGPERFFGDHRYDLSSSPNGPAQATGRDRRRAAQDRHAWPGLDNDTLEACLQDADKAQDAGGLVSGERRSRRDRQSTPSFVINGTKIRT